MGATLLNRSARGVELTDAGRAFMDHARLALMQVDAAIEAARKAAQPAKERFALGFLTGEEMRWLPEAMQILRGKLPHADVSVTSDYSPNLADAVARGKLDVAFLRAEPDFDLVYRTVRQEPLVVLMPSDHPLALRRAVHPQDLIGEPFFVREQGSGTRLAVERFLEAAELPRDTLVELGSDSAIKQVVMAGLGISILSRQAIELEVGINRLAVLPVIGLPLRRQWFSSVPA